MSAKKISINDWNISFDDYARGIREAKRSLQLDLPGALDAGCRAIQKKCPIVDEHGASLVMSLSSEASGIPKDVLAAAAFRNTRDLADFPAPPASPALVALYEVAWNFCWVVVEVVRRVSNNVQRYRGCNDAFEWAVTGTGRSYHGGVCRVCRGRNIYVGLEPVDLCADCTDGLAALTFMSNLPIVHGDLSRETSQFEVVVSCPAHTRKLALQIYRMKRDFRLAETERDDDASSIAVSPTPKKRRSTGSEEISGPKSTL